ncbi:MAG: putative membrane protein YckC, RDD family [Candidatus Methanohalarchaeum thermophilum]|uniref:Membrane protein YckC, RDD family n=1 Tax=Methanohalarchaeum thermophilum TaxID=1903181 RepID=A0A1Q6DUR4_METT1|nr:MAG: putative membrane protein YckC, RDD family [Candidatus Methanohalarchaeum thermophilum]
MSGNLAGYPARLMSFLIDFVLVSVLSYLVSLVVSEVYLFYLVSFAIGFCYFAYFFKKQATPGMNVVDLKLVKFNSSNVSYIDGIVRYLGMIFSTFVFFIGFLWIIIDENNQGWHDKLAGTYVVKETPRI